MSVLWQRVCCCVPAPVNTLLILQNHTDKTKDNLKKVFGESY